MRTFALISQKGGAGKSTLARQLAVIAGESGPSYLIDRDPQATSSKWCHRRQGSADPSPPWPVLIDLEGATLTKAVAALRSQDGCLFIDTRPAVTEPEAEAARVADFVIVPVRPSPDDLEAVPDTIAMVRKLGRKPLVVVNQAKHERRALEARAALAEHGMRVCPHHIADRACYLDASAQGYGMGEMRGAAAAAADAELRRVWAWVLEAGNE